MKVTKDALVASRSLQGLHRSTVSLGAGGSCEEEQVISDVANLVQASLVNPTSEAAEVLSVSQTEANSVNSILWTSDGILRQALLSPGLVSFPGPEESKEPKDSPSLNLENVKSSGAPLPPMSELPRPGSLPPTLTLDQQSRGSLLNQCNPPNLDRENRVESRPSTTGLGSPLLVLHNSESFNGTTQLSTMNQFPCSVGYKLVTTPGHLTSHAGGSLGLVSTQAPLPPISEVHKANQLMSTVNEMHLQRMDHRDKDSSLNFHESPSSPMPPDLLVSSSSSLLSQLSRASLPTMSSSQVSSLLSALTSDLSNSDIDLGPSPRKESELSGLTSDLGTSDMELETSPPRKVIVMTSLGSDLQQRNINSSGNDKVSNLSQTNQLDDLSNLLPLGPPSTNLINPCGSSLQIKVTSGVSNEKSTNINHLKPIFSRLAPTSDLPSSTLKSVPSPRFALPLVAHSVARNIKTTIKQETAVLLPTPGTSTEDLKKKARAKRPKPVKPPKPTKPEKIIKLDKSVWKDTKKIRNPEAPKKVVSKPKNSLRRKKNEEDNTEICIEEQQVPSLVEKVACFKCTFCPFLSLDKDGVDNHIQLEHTVVICSPEDVEDVAVKNGNNEVDLAVQSVERQELRCPGCPNVFFAIKSLRVHLVQDHRMNDVEVKTILNNVCNPHADVSVSKEIITPKPEKKQKKVSAPQNGAELEVYMDEQGKIRVRTPIPPQSLQPQTDPVPKCANSGGEGCDSSDIDLPPAENEEVIDVTVETKNVVKRRGRPRGSRNIGITALRRQNPTLRLGEKELGYCCAVDCCAVRMKSHDNIEYHRRCHSGDVFTCPECTEVFGHWRALSAHLWRAHVIDMELYGCDQCSFKTNSWSKLQNLHKRIHSSERPFLCDTCGKGFKTSKQLRNHKVIHAVKVKHRPLKSGECDVCRRHFADKRMLRLHKDTVHNKLRPFLCNYCGYSASSRSTLKMHMRQHTGEKPFSCEECDYRTSDHNSLRRHRMRHSGEKPYKCPYCAYACIQSSTYKTHLKNKHPGQDDGLLFSCPLCPFRTIKRENHVAHLSEHNTGNIPSKGSRAKKNTNSTPPMNVSQGVSTNVNSKKKKQLKKVPEELQISDKEDDPNEIQSITLAASSPISPVETLDNDDVDDDVLPQDPIIVSLGDRQDQPIATSATILPDGNFAFMYSTASTPLEGLLQSVTSGVLQCYSAGEDGRFPILASQLKVLGDMRELGSPVITLVDSGGTLSTVRTQQIVQINPSDLVPVSLSGLTSSQVNAFQLALSGDNEPEQITGDLSEGGSQSGEIQEIKFKVSEEIVNLTGSS